MQKGELFFLKYRAAEMYRQCRYIHWITGIGKTSGGKIRDGTLKEMTTVQKTSQLFLCLLKPVYSVFDHKFKT